MEFRSVASLESALADLDHLGADAHVLAGGTDLTVQYLRGEVAPKCLLHIESVSELRFVGNGAGVTLGALVSHQTLANHPTVADHARSVAEGAATVGGWQTMVTGTIGGNICNASPAADVVPPLLVHDAEVILASHGGGERRLPLGQFITGRRQVVREPNELLTAVVFPAAPPRTGDAYVKVGRRGAMEIAIVGLAARLTFDEGGRVADARVAVGSMAPTARRAEKAEQALVGSALEPAAVEEAGRLLLEVVEPIDDVRGSASYRLVVAPRVLARAVELCRQRALGGA